MPERASRDLTNRQLHYGVLALLAVVAGAAVVWTAVAPSDDTVSSDRLAAGNGTSTEQVAKVEQKATEMPRRRGDSPAEPQGVRRERGLGDQNPKIRRSHGRGATREQRVRRPDPAG